MSDTPTPDARLLRRLVRACGGLPDAWRPLQDALCLSEQQARCVLDALQCAQHELDAMRGDDGGLAQPALQRLELQLSSLRNAQRSQEVAGRLLRESIAVLQALESRLREAQELLEQHGPRRAPAARPGASQDPRAPRSRDPDGFDKPCPSSEP